MFDRVENIFRSFLNIKKIKSLKKNTNFFDLGIFTLVTLVLSYILSTVAIAILVKPLVETLKQTKIKTNEVLNTVKVDGLNFRDIKKDVEGRNIFNSSGEFPDEMVLEEEDKPKEEFTLDGPCPNTNLKLKLVGTVYLSSKHAYATVREDGYEYADIYTMGDYLYDQENISVAAIYPKMVILNNDGKRECLYATETLEEIGESGGRFEDYDGEYKSKPKEKEQENISGIKNILLQSSWVESQLGDGFSKILQTARMVPNVVGENVEGFKVFSIQSETLFDKVGLKDGDVVLKVNSTYLDAENGFALYQSFLDDRDLSIEIKRGNKQHTIKVEIK